MDVRSLFLFDEFFYFAWLDATPRALHAINSLSAKSILAGEKLLATYSIST